MIKLLHPDKAAVENYEALMALTNLAGVDASVRKRIVKEQGISNIEQYMFDEHEDLRRAGTECICNMAKDDDVSLSRIQAAKIIDSSAHNSVISSCRFCMFTKSQTTTASNFWSSTALKRISS